MRHTFDSSGRTTYLFFSVENWKGAYNIAERRADRMREAVRTYEEGRFRMTDFVTIKRNVVASIDVSVSVQAQFPYEGEDECLSLILPLLDRHSGIFKLESSERLTASEAFCKYRARSTVEHLIHLLTRVH